MIRTCTKTLAVCLLGAGALAMNGAPADPRPRAVTLPDGSSMTMSLVGDEFFHVWYTADGRPAIESADGWFHYLDADGLDSGIRLGEAAPSIDTEKAVAAYRARSGRTADVPRRTLTRASTAGESKWDNADGHDIRGINTEGNVRGIAILVSFDDLDWSVSNTPREAVYDMLNKEGYDEGEAYGSALDYFRHVSGGAFNPHFDVYGPVKLSKIERDYVSTTETYKDPVSGKDVAVYAPGRMIEEACRLLDNEIDFKQYDQNGDGYVDLIYVFFAGRGATTGGSTLTTIWPHAFTLNAAIGSPIELDGVLLNRYATSAEVGMKGQLAGVGTFCHEFSHVLGLPDMYDTANNNGTASKCFTPGSFSLMDAGNYNNNEYTPPTMSSYERYALEWNKPVEITGSADITLLPLAVSGQAYKVPVKRASTEYYLLEARHRQGWDKYLEGEGLAIWHIDYSEQIWKANSPNNVADHQRIDLIEIDDDQTLSTRDGDLMPGSTGVFEFQDNGQPSFTDWNRQSTGYNLENVRKNPDGSVSLRIVADNGTEMESMLLDRPVARAEQLSATSATLRWNPVEGADTYYVNVYEPKDDDGQHVNDFVDGYYFAKTTGLSMDIAGLDPGHTYLAVVYAANGMNTARAESPVAFTTQGEDFAEAAPGIYAYSTEDGKTTIGWDAVEGASEYRLTVAVRSQGNETGSAEYGFDGSAMPEGWSGTGRFETRDRYCGKSAPSYMLAWGGNTLTTSETDADMGSVSFHAVRRYDDHDAVLHIYGAGKEGDYEPVAVVDGFKTDGSDHKIALPAGIRSLRFSYEQFGSDLTLYLDDIVITTVGEPVDKAVEGLDNVASTDTSRVISGLDPETEYVAYVTPYAGGEKGLTSRVLTFRPADVPSGVAEVTAGGKTVEYRIDGGIVVCNDPDERFDVYAVDGAAIAVGVSSATLPAHGIYVVRGTHGSVKLAY